MTSADPVFAWLSSQKPLDVLARAIESKLLVSGPPLKKDATKWSTDPEREAVMRALFDVRWMGGKAYREERFVWVADKKSNRVFAYAPPTDQNDASYYSREWESDNKATHKKHKYFITYAQGFGLKYKGTAMSEEILGGLLQACAVNLEITYGKKISLGNLSVLPLIRPRFVPCLPLPSKTGELEWRCTASGATWQATIGVSCAYGGTRPPTVLVTGPPGSGKEAYARAIHFGQRRNASGKDHDIVTQSLAGLGADALRSRLSLILGGLEARQGTLFLDEVDKAEPPARSRLLRILENRTYETDTGAEASCKHVAFVVAAGKPLSALRGMEPPDFWTRMETHIAVGDPLTAGSQDERQRLLEAFFKFFWWDWVSDWLAGYGGLYSPW